MAGASGTVAVLDSVSPLVDGTTVVVGDGFAGLPEWALELMSSV